MQAKSHLPKQPVKTVNRTYAPYPNIITQVNKEDEKKFQILNVFKISRYCALFWRCLAPKVQAPPNKPLINLLQPQQPQFRGKKTLVLDLDETLVHSTFDPVENPDIVLPVKIQGMVYRINVLKRPGAEEFLAKVGEMFEVVVFTASLAEYADPLVRALDKKNSVSSILFRQHCTSLNGTYVKDLSLLGRDMKDVILVDNSPNSFLFQPENAYHIKNFFDDKRDRELVRLADFLDKVVDVEDVRPIEELRKQFEPERQQKVKKFVKVTHEDQQPEQKLSPKTKKKKEEREKNYNIETEPDLRRDDRESELVRLPNGDNNRDIPYVNNMSKAVPLTERIVINDRLLGATLDFSDDMELPSPKESDALINHAEPVEADTYCENNSNSTDSKESKKASIKPKVPPLNKANSAGVFASRGKVGDDPEIQKIDEVRFLTGTENLNSPIGRQIKIEFENK